MKTIFQNLNRPRTQSVMLLLHMEVDTPINTGTLPIPQYSLGSTRNG